MGNLCFNEEVKGILSTHVRLRTHDMRGRSSSAGNHDRRVFWLVSCLLLALYALTLFLPHRHNNLMAGDAQSYYAYMRTLWLDRDIDLRNDAALFNSRLPVPHDPAFEMRDEVYHFSIGPAVLWSPAFLLGHGTAVALLRLGVAMDPNGYSLFEQSVVGFASVLYGCLTLFLLHALLKRSFSPMNACFATLYTAFAGSFIYYQLLEPHMSHVLSAFSCTLFLFLLLQQQDSTRIGNTVALGLAAGLMFLVRWQDAVFLFLLLPVAWKQTREQSSRRLFALSGLFLAVLFLAALPQLLFWRAAYGQWLTLPQGEGFMRWTEPNVLLVLFSLRHGLITWTPIVLLALLGLALGVRDGSRRAAAWGYLIVVCMAVYVNAAAGDWWAGASFGARRFTGLLPVFAWGIAIVFERAQSRHLRAVIHSVCAFLVVFNLLFVAQYRLETIPHETAITFRQWTADKLTLPLTLPRIVFDKLQSIGGDRREERD